MRKLFEETVKQLAEKEGLCITAGANEGSKFWLGMLNDLKNRGKNESGLPYRKGVPLSLLYS